MPGGRMGKYGEAFRRWFDEIRAMGDEQLAAIAEECRVVLDSTHVSVPVREAAIVIQREVEAERRVRGVRSAVDHNDQAPGGQR